MRKNFLCLFLCLTLLVSLLPMTVVAGGAYYQIDDTVFYSNVDSSGEGWAWDSKAKTLTLNGYDGESIITNTDITINVTGASKVYGSFARSEGAGYEAISVVGDLTLNVQAELTLDSWERGDNDDTYTDWGIRSGSLKLNVSQTGKITGTRRIELLIGFNKASNITCEGQIKAENGLFYVQGSLDLDVDGSISAEGSFVIDSYNNVAVILGAPMNITGKGSITIGSNYSQIQTGIDSDYSENLTVGGSVKLNVTANSCCIDVSNFTANNDCEINLKCSNRGDGIKGSNISFNDNVKFVFSGGEGINASNITFANKDINAIVSGRFCYANRYLYYKPSGISTIISDSYIFAVDHGSVYFQGSGTDYLTASEGIVYNEYGGCNWNRSGKSVLTSNDSTFSCLSSFTGSGELTITSTNGTALRLYLQYVETIRSFDYTGKITIKDSKYGIYCASTLNMIGDCDFDIETSGAAICGSKDVNISGSGSIVATSYDDAVIKSENGNVTISGDGDITLNTSECRGIIAANNITLGGDGEFKVIGSGPAFSTTEGNVYFDGNRTANIVTQYNAVEFKNTENSIILDGTGSIISIETTRDNRNVITGSDKLVIDENDAYEITSGDPASNKVVYELKKAEVTPEATPEATPTAEPTPEATPTSTPEVVVTVAPTANPTAEPTTRPVLVAGAYTEEQIPSVTGAKVDAELSVGDFVTRCYRVALGREPEEEGYKYWTDNLNNGSACGAQVGFGFIFSREYQNKERTNEQFVTDLYSMFFGREADTDGYTYWLDQLNNGVSREKVFAGFANSQEFYNLCLKYGVVSGWYAIGVDNNSQGGVNCFVARLYKICLTRLPDLGGQSYWVSQLIDGNLDGTTAAFGFVFSEEFTNLKLEDDEFVAYMYEAFFGRPADVDGFNYWMLEMANGMDRNSVFNGFTGSAEFINLCSEYGIKA